MVRCLSIDGVCHSSPALHFRPRSQRPQAVEAEAVVVVIEPDVVLLVDLGLLVGAVVCAIVVSRRRRRAIAAC